MSSACVVKLATPNDFTSLHYRHFSSIAHATNIDCLFQGTLSSAFASGSGLWLQFSITKSKYYNFITELGIHTLKGGAYVLFDVRGVVHLVRYEELLPWETQFKLVWYLLPLLVLELVFGLEYLFQGITQQLLIVADVKVSVACLCCLHHYVIDVEGFVVGAEVLSAKPYEGQIIFVRQNYLWVRIHQLYNMTIMHLLLTLLLLAVASCDEAYRRVIHRTDPKAVCLDGTPPALYIHEGGDPTNFLIFFIGGGFCGEQSLSATIQSCYQRSKTDLGSSNFCPPTLTGQGYLSTNSTTSAFATWTKVVLWYCDGAMHQGYTATPLQYKDTQLHFRGAAITRSHFTYLLREYNLFDANKILLTGASAGGIGTFTWVNYLRSIVRRPQGVYSAPDSGTFMNHPSSVTLTHKAETQLYFMSKMANVDERTPLTQCNAEQVDRQHRCLFLQYSYHTIQGKILLINSQYDTYSIQDIIDVSCLKKGQSGAATLTQCSTDQLNAIEDYRNHYRAFVGEFMREEKNSVWTISCSTHTYAAYKTMYDVDSERIPMRVGMKVRDAVERFVLEDQRIYAIDNVSWPLNNPCAY